MSFVLCEGLEFGSSPVGYFVPVLSFGINVFDCCCWMVIDEVQESFSVNKGSCIWMAVRPLAVYLSFEEIRHTLCDDYVIRKKKKNIFFF